jgi:hypothetical protein
MVVHRVVRRINISDHTAVPRTIPLRNALGLMTLITSWANGGLKYGRARATIAKISASAQTKIVLKGSWPLLWQGSHLQISSSAKQNHCVRSVMDTLMQVHRFTVRPFTPYPYGFVMLDGRPGSIAKEFNKQFTFVTTNEPRNIVARSFVTTNQSVIDAALIMWKKSTWCIATTGTTLRTVTRSFTRGPSIPSSSCRIMLEKVKYAESSPWTLWNYLLLFRHGRFASEMKPVSTEMAFISSDSITISMRLSEQMTKKFLCVSTTPISKPTRMMSRTSHQLASESDQLPITWTTMPGELESTMPRTLPTLTVTTNFTSLRRVPLTLVQT